MSDVNTLGTETPTREQGTFEVVALAPQPREGTLAIASVAPGASSEQSYSILVSSTGAVYIVEEGVDKEPIFKTDDGFLTANDQFTTHATWSSTTGTVITVQNEETGATEQITLSDSQVFSAGSEVQTIEQTGDNTGTGVLTAAVQPTETTYTVRPVEENIAIKGAVNGTSDNDIIDANFADAEEEGVSRANDSVIAGQGDDQLYGYAGADTLFGGTGSDAIDGGEGNDQIFGGTGADKIDGGAGTDAILSGSGDDFVIVDDGFGLADSEADKVNAGAGSDTIMAGAGDYVDGGASKGDVNVLIINDGDQVTGVKYNDDQTSGVVQYSDGQSLTFQNIQQIQGLGVRPSIDGIVNGTAQGDVIDQSYDQDPHGDSVDAGDAVLPGDTNDMDVIEAYGGNDTITAGNEDDEVFSGTGNDWAQGNAGDDFVDGEQGADTLYGDNGNAVLMTNTGPSLSADMIQAQNKSLAADSETTYCVGEDGELCIDFDTEKSMVTEDVWFASSVVVTSQSGEILGDCTVLEGENNEFTVKLDQVVTQDTWITVNITDGTANQAGDPEEFIPNPVYTQYDGVTQYWWQNASHFSWAQGQSWYNGINNNLMSSGPDAQGNVTTDSYVGVNQLTNDFRVFDENGTEVTGQTFQVMVPAGSDTSNAFSVEGLRETSINGMNQTFGGAPIEGDETFTLQVTEIGGQSVAAPVKDVDILDDPANTYSPIAFDLSGNGQIDVTGTSTAYGHAYNGGATVSFDIDNDGVNEDIEWLAGNGDGLLIDMSQVGLGNAVDGGALFGDEGGTYANGYAKLDLRDLNGDDLLTDTELSNLAIWVDDGDAVLEAGETVSLASEGIDELVTVATPTVINGETLLRSETKFDAEVTGDVEYSLSGPDAQYFEIDKDTGKLTYKDGFDPQYDTPVDADGDNVYEFNVVRNCTKTNTQELEAVNIKIEDPCIGGDDTLVGGSGDDVIFGQGGDDSIMGEGGNDTLDGGCGDDTIIGDNGDGGVDMDASDGCVTVIDDVPCFCLDIGTTKTMVTEDVWFAGKVVITDTSGQFVGTCDLKEGEDGVFTIEMDSAVNFDREIQIQITDGTANQVTGGFNEFENNIYWQSSPYLGNPTTNETQWWFGDSAHASTISASFPSWQSALFGTPTPAAGSTTGTYSDAYVGPNQLVNDFEILDANGTLVTGNIVTVTVPAGQTMSEAFTVETNLETMIRGYPNSEYYTYVEGDEAFDMQIVAIDGQTVNGASKEVMIEDQHYNVYSPIAFDLNWDGQINVTGSSTAYGHAFDTNAATVDFNIDGSANNSEECIEWMVANTDGLLIDMAQVAIDGGLATGRALFGDEGGTYANGYEKLDLRDTIGGAGGDDVLTGSELDDLAIWIDDGDGDLEAGETVSLASQGITELSTVMTPTVVGGETLFRSETEVDMEATGMVTYTLGGDDAQYFDIDENTGKITYADGFIPDANNPLDADQNGEYEIEVIRNGTNFNEPAVEPITIKIEDDAPGGNDSLTGGMGNDVIDGEGGNDTIFGESGDDCIDGGFGDDVLIGDFGNDNGVAADDCDEVVIDYANYDASASTASSAVYNNAAVVGGVSVSARINLVSAASGTGVTLGADTEGEIVLSSLATNGGIANFEMEFFDPITNQPIVLNPVVVFSDLDDPTGANEVLRIYSGVTAASTNSTTNVVFEYDNTGDGLKAAADANHADSQFGDPASALAVKFDTSSKIEFSLFAPNGTHKFNFGNPADGDFDLNTSTYDDKITGGWGSDTIEGNMGNDTIDSGGECDDKTELCDSTDPDPNNDRDLVYGGSGDDQIETGDDADTVYGGQDADTISGGMDADLIFGDSGDDVMSGDQGDDTLDGGAGSDIMYGGDDRDTFLNAGDGDCVDGGTGSKAPGDVDDYDILDLTHLDNYSITQTVDADGNSTSGTVNILDDNGNVTGTIKFNEIEEIVCFTAGTMIATDRGERKVEDLEIGDLVLTRDNGLQPVTWCGSKAITGDMLQNDPSLRPVMIEAGSLGHNLPAQDLMVSPNHRVVVENATVELLFEEAEVLVAAKHLVGKPGIYAVDIAGTDYVHFMCDRHEVVLSNGAWTESFQPGDMALNGVDADQREELFKLFPELRTEEGRDAFHSARMILKSHEAKLAI